jgi:predicted AAA+ superfamily ATPase
MTARIARPDYEERLLPYLGTEDIKVLIGVRRSGKSTLL